MRDIHELSEEAKRRRSKSSWCRCDLGTATTTWHKQSAVFFRATKMSRSFDRLAKISIGTIRTKPSAQLCDQAPVWSTWLLQLSARRVWSRAGMRAPQPHAQAPSLAGVGWLRWRRNKPCSLCTTPWLLGGGEPIWARRRVRPHSSLHQISSTVAITGRNAPLYCPTIAPPLSSCVQAMLMLPCYSKSRVVVALPVLFSYSSSAPSWRYAGSVVCWEGWIVPKVIKIAMTDRRKKKPFLCALLARKNATLFSTVLVWYQVGLRATKTHYARPALSCFLLVQAPGMFSIHAVSRYEISYTPTSVQRHDQSRCDRGCLKRYKYPAVAPVITFFAFEEMDLKNS